MLLGLDSKYAANRLFLASITLCRIVFQQAYHAATVIRQMQRMALTGGATSSAAAAQDANGATNN